MIPANTFARRVGIVWRVPIPTHASRADAEQALVGT